MACVVTDRNCPVSCVYEAKCHLSSSVGNPLLNVSFAYLECPQTRSHSKLPDVEAVVVTYAGSM